MTFAFAVVFLCSVGAVAHGARPSLRLRDGGGVVALQDGGLVWNRNGEVQVVRSDGTSMSVVRLRAAAAETVPLQIMSVVGVGERALLLGHLRSRSDGNALSHVIFEVDTSGRVRALPGLPRESYVVRVVPWNGRVWTESLDGEIRELLPDGQLGERLREAPRGEPLDVAPPELIGGPSDSPVFYVPADATKANGHAAYCYTDGRHKWKSSDGCSSRPQMCGNSLIELDAASGAFSVRSIADGRLVAKSRVERQGVMICDGDGRVLMAGRTVTELSLPDLKRLWSIDLKNERAKGLLRAGEHVVVFSNRGSIVLPVPPAAAPGGARRPR